MKRTWLILAAGLLLAVVSYGAFYFGATARDRCLLNDQAPELAWLKQEYNLSDAEFKRVVELHSAYEPRCAEMCRRIATKEAELRDLLAHSTSVTPEIARKLSEAAEIRAECQSNMLNHFYEVSRTMPPEQGRRYLAWVQENTFLSGGTGTGMQMDMKSK